jgi:hypothetical protein
MSPRGKPAASPRPALSRPGKRPENNKRMIGAANAATRRWRQNGRPKSIRATVSATKSLHWSRPLIEAVLEELYIDDHFEELLGTAPGDLRSGQYAQAVALAVILRHSWHPDDLACVLQRLKLRVSGG